jgi:hypothetical protein
MGKFVEAFETFAAAWKLFSQHKSCFEVLVKFEAKFEGV